MKSRYVMSYMACIYGVVGMSGYINDWTDNDPNFRRALDDTASSLDAPLKNEYRRFFDLTFEKSYSEKLPAIVSKYGSRAPFILHLLAHTDPRWDPLSISRLRDLYIKYDITIDKDLKNALFRAKELRLLVAKKHQDLIPSVRRAEEEAKARKVVVKIDPRLIEKVERVYSAEDEEDLDDILDSYRDDYYD